MAVTPDTFLAPQATVARKPAGDGLRLGAIVMVYLIFMLLLASQWMLGGEMWAEMATNYLANALKPDLYHQLLATDAGYIPLPQRLIAWAVRGLPLTVMPYAYTWIAAVLSALLAGVFSLSRFRVLVPSDGLRVAACLLVLCVMGFATRSFINFIYFGAFFLAVLTALPWVHRHKNTPMPWYAWFMPLLMMSKPSLLVALPGMVVTALLCKSRSFRWITVAAVWMASLQLWQMRLSQQMGQMAAQNAAHPLIERLLSAVAYFFGTLGGYLTGPLINLGLAKVWVGIPVLLGVLAVTGVMGLARRSRSHGVVPVWPLIGVGLSMLAFTSLLNNFTLGTDWNLTLDGLRMMRIIRHVLPAYTGCLLVLLGLWPVIVAWLTSFKWINRLRHPGVTLFCAWAIGSGWALYGAAATVMPVSPKVNNSYWRQLAPQLTHHADMCIPLDPYGWVYSQGQCKGLQSAEMDWKAYDSELPVDHVVVLPNARQQNARVLSVGVLVRPVTAQTVRVLAQLTTDTGATLSFDGQRTIPASGGLVMLTLPNPVSHPRQLSLKLAEKTGTIGHLPTGKPAVLWFGWPL